MADEVRAAVRWESSGKGAVIADAKEIGASVEAGVSKASVAGKKYMADMAAAQREGMRQLKQHAAALELDAQMTEKAAAAARSMALQQIEAAAMNDKFAASANNANKAVASSVQGMGTLKGGLASAITAMSGMPPQLTLITSQLAVMGAGFLPVIAALAAIAAGVGIWKLWNAESIKAAEAQDKAFESLKQFNLEAKQGFGGKTAQDLADLRKGIAGLADEIDKRKKSYGPGGMIEAFRVAFGGKSQEQQLAEKQATAAETQTNLSAKFGQTTGAMALQVQRQNELNDAFGKGALALDLINNRFDYLDDRLKHSTGTTDGERAALDALSATLRAQKDEAARNATGWNETQRKARELTADLPALTAAFDALPPSLTRVNIGLVQTIGQYDAVMSVQTMLIQKHDEIKASLNALADKNKQTTDAQQAETAKSIAAQAKYAQDMKNISSSGFGKIITDGTKSFHDFFEDVLQMFSSMLSRMQQEGKGSTIGAKLLGIGSAAIGGGFAGYQIGQSTGSAASGLLGGAVSGAALGSAAGPWGAVVGGLAGAAGGLLGAAAAQKEAAKAITAAQTELGHSIAGFVAQGGSQVQQQIAALKSQQVALNLAAKAVGDDMFKHGQNGQAYYDTQSSLTRTAYANQLQTLTGNFWLGITQSMNALKGPAGDYQNALIKINVDYVENIKSASALHATQEQQQQITDLYTASIKALNDAMEKANETAQKGYGNRQLTAIFGSGSDEVFNAQQAQELAAAIADGLSPQTIEMLKQTQKMEAAQREREKQTQILQDSLNTANDSLSSLKTQEDQAKQTIATLQATMQTIQKGADALKIGDLSALSPAEQYAESLRQLKEFVAKAQAGDQDAAKDVIGAANTFLQESKMMYASSEPYGADFDYVQSLLSGLGLQYGAQLTTAEKMLEALQTQEALLVAQIQIMNAQLQQSAYDAALSRQTYVRGTANDPNFMAGNASNSASFPVGLTGGNGSGGMPLPGTVNYPAGLNPWDPNSAAGQALAISMGQSTGGGPGKVFIPGQGWIDPRAIGNEWLLDPSNVSGPAYAAMKAAGYPGFAMGGNFGGGMRWVGEGGPELELTGPSHIVNNSDTRNLVANMALIGDLVTEVKGLREDLRTSSKQAISDGRVTGGALATRLDKAIGRLDAQVRIATFADRNTGAG